MSVSIVDLDEVPMSPVASTSTTATATVANGESSTDDDIFMMDEPKQQRASFISGQSATAKERERERENGREREKRGCP